jgi:hypothetical protein
MIESAVKLYGGTFFDTFNEIAAIHYAHNNVGIEGERSLLHKSSVDNFDAIMKVLEIEI